jgi:hypothetical protein
MTLTTPITMTAASKIRVVTKPMDAAWLFRRMTGYRATAVPMHPRALTRSKKAPRSTCLSAPALTI